MRQLGHGRVRRPAAGSLGDSEAQEPASVHADEQPIGMLRVRTQCHDSPPGQQWYRIAVHGFGVQPVQEVEPATSEPEPAQGVTAERSDADMRRQRNGRGTNRLAGKFEGLQPIRGGKKELARRQSESVKDLEGLPVGPDERQGRAGTSR